MNNLLSNYNPSIISQNLDKIIWKQNEFIVEPVFNLEIIRYIKSWGRKLFADIIQCLNNIRYANAQFTTKVVIGKVCLDVYNIDLTYVGTFSTKMTEKLIKSVQFIPAKLDISKTRKW